MIHATRGRQDEGAVAVHYDELDPFYRTLWGEHLHHGLWRRGDETPSEAQENLVDLVADHLGLSSGMEVCDIGCGYGGTARRLTERWGARATGVTISRAQYDYAQAQVLNGGGPSYLLRSWLENELPDESFDGLVAIESIAHIADKQRAFAEAARVLKPGGRLVVCDWLIGPALRPWEVRYLIEPICREARLPHMASGAEYRSWMRTSGLVVRHAEDLTRRVRRTWSAAVRRVLHRLVTDTAIIRYLRDPSNQDRRMALAMLRIPAAYRTGCMRYELIVAERPSPDAPAT